MSIKKRRKGKTRLTGRNTLETLNDLIHLMNGVQPETERIEPIKTPRNLFELRQRIKLRPPLGNHKEPDPTERVVVEQVEVVPQVVVQTLTVIATQAWRARKKMVDDENGEARDDMKRVFRHVESIFNALSGIGIEIRDMQGRPFDSGMALKVVSFEPTPGLSKEEITETIKPTILWRERIIEVGEVIVGTPQAK